MNNVTFTITYLADKVDDIISIRYEITLIFDQLILIGSKSALRILLFEIKLNFTKQKEA